VTAAFDYIIVGSGSAGSALAYRLSEDGRHSVLVLEYGGTDMGPLIQMPAALSIPMNMPLYDWGYVSEPEPHLGGRQLVAPRGKVIGGSSSINGMVYVRGHARDFDGWEKMGASTARRSDTRSTIPSSASSTSSTRWARRCRRSSAANGTRRRSGSRWTSTRRPPSPRSSIQRVSASR
jgi:choline dehydrogenase-like flavoprotein